MNDALCPQAWCNAPVVGHVGGIACLAPEGPRTYDTVYALPIAPAMWAADMRDLSH